MQREIIRIDEEMCDGCGQCVDACAEGAIEIIEGKAKLTRDSYCDGLGACIGDCPQGALTIEVRDASDFDEEAVKQHLAQMVSQTPVAKLPVVPRSPAVSQGCPGSATRKLERPPQESRRREGESTGPSPSALQNWPVQIHLVPVSAPYLQGSRLLIAADCVPFAYPDFHRDHLDGKVLLVGCPKLDDAEAYREKLTEMFRQNDIQDVQVGIMEVPCCTGLAFVVKEALAKSGKPIPAELTRFGIQGGTVESTDL